MKIINVLFLAILFTACSDASPPDVPATDNAANEVTQATPAEAILARTLTAHGGERYEAAAYRFTFRNMAYTFTNKAGSYVYTRTQQQDEKTVVDVLDGSKLSRTVDGNPVELDEKKRTAYSNSINSVIYFATLPHKLLDPAVNLNYAGEQTVGEQTYDLLRVDFDQEGGGEDHDDNFVYWINRDTDRIDYLAYDYRTDGGGVRFRSAYTPRLVDGILFQDYVNYKAPLGTKLEDLTGMYERGELEELSRIETEDVERLK